jgi:hypothetical protein
VLDHFGVASAGLVGISMGGYWALRAAGREPRIDRVVAWPPVYDWLHRLPTAVRGPTRAMLRRRRFMRWSVRTRARLVPSLRLVVDQTLYLLDSDDPVDAMDWFLGMNAAHLESERVTQDVLLLCGEHDAFQPPLLTSVQAKALTAAHSVTCASLPEPSMPTSTARWATSTLPAGSSPTGCRTPHQPPLTPDRQTTLADHAVGVVGVVALAASALLRCGRSHEGYGILAVGMLSHDPRRRAIPRRSPRPARMGRTIRAPADRAHLIRLGGAIARGMLAPCGDRTTSPWPFPHYLRALMARTHRWTNRLPRACSHHLLRRARHRTEVARGQTADARRVRPLGGGPVEPDHNWCNALSQRWSAREGCIGAMPTPAIATSARSRPGSPSLKSAYLSAGMPPPHRNLTSRRHTGSRWGCYGHLE